jgi:hypothetical protein
VTVAPRLCHFVRRGLHKAECDLLMFIGASSDAAFSKGSDNLQTDNKLATFWERDR